ncbi:WD repeat-containing protein 92 [Catenaria anguillulae PL171]|uniref:WD repeat-containing protein 92 n=1 Tax=Catenaria anguillulae PL171 TaxID=765915 RepID=A0A1Y2HE78_9FUNG|nr:WD repeat-containing protein 92 [Catenaria anguillulae PL171]
MTISSDKPQIINHSTLSLDFTPHSTAWLPRTARVCVVGESTRGTGQVHVYELHRGGLQLVSKSETPAAFKCATLGASPLGRQCMATGDMKGEMAVWDLERMDVPVYRAAKAHEGVVNAVDACAGRTVGCGAPEIATASRDGCVKVWDIRQKDSPVAQIAPQRGESTRDCWTVAFGNSFNNDDRWVAAGYDNGDLKLFDLRAMAVVWETNLKNGVVSVQFDRWDIKANKLVAGTLEAGIHVFDLRTLHPEQGFAQLRETQPGSNATVWAVKHSPHNRDLFVASSGQGALSLYKYNYPNARSAKDDKDRAYGVMGSLDLIQSATVAEQPIASFDWSPDKQGLCAYTAYDQTVRVGIVTKLNQL